jgi:nicotinamide riboside kinase
MMKVAVVGAHGVGKTELSNALWSYCNRIGRTAEMVHEVARDCPLPIGDQQTIASTLWICCHQIERELEAEHRQPDYVICDRCILDPIVYLLAYKPDEVYPEVVEFCEHYSKTYDKMVLVRPSNKPIRPDEFRNTDKEEQYMIDNIFTNWVVGRCQLVDSDTIFGSQLDQLCKQILGDLK